MSFRASNHTNECGKSARALASALVPCCTSPARSIEEQRVATPKLLVKVDQITPGFEKSCTGAKLFFLVKYSINTFESPYIWMESMNKCLANQSNPYKANISDLVFEPMPPFQKNL